MSSSLVSRVVLTVLTVFSLTLVDAAINDFYKPYDSSMSCAYLGGSVEARGDDNATEADSSSQAVSEAFSVREKITRIGCYLITRKIRVTKVFIIKGQRVLCRGVTIAQGCQGFCRSHYYIDPYTTTPKKNCQCCKAGSIGHTIQYVDFDCGKCTYYKYPLACLAPQKCACSPCH